MDYAIEDTMEDNVLQGGEQVAMIQMDAIDNLEVGDQAAGINADATDIEQSHCNCLCNCLCKCPCSCFSSIISMTMSIPTADLQTATVLPILFFHPLLTCTALYEGTIGVELYCSCTVLVMLS